LTAVAAFILLFFFLFPTAFQKSAKAANEFDLAVIPFFKPFAEYFHFQVDKKMKKASFSYFSWIFCFHVTKLAF
jgi:hypothetical protein